VKLLDWFFAWQRARRRRRYLAWLSRMKLKHVVFDKPLADTRDWQGQFRKLHERRR
jgi:hypothetical protein